VRPNGRLAIVGDRRACDAVPAPHRPKGEIWQVNVRRAASTNATW
jgi:hypothetical protein